MRFPVSAFCVVGMTGFEPATPWSQTRYSTGLNYIPNAFSVLRKSGAKIAFLFYEAMKLLDNFELLETFVQLVNGDVNLFFCVGSHQREAD